MEKTAITRITFGDETQMQEREDTVRSFAAIIDGECDDIPEQAFRYKSDIDSVREAYAAMSKE